MKRCLLRLLGILGYVVGMVPTLIQAIVFILVFVICGISLFNKYNPLSQTIYNYIVKEKKKERP